MKHDWDFSDNCLIQGNNIRTKHVGKDILAGIKNIFGVRQSTYTKLLSELHKEASNRMIQQAVVIKVFAKVLS